MNVIKENIKKYKLVLEKIKKYNTIVIYRHELPDFDAAGTQHGLARWLKDNFPSKTIYTLGNDFEEYTPKLFPKNDNVDLNRLKDFLAIIVDTSIESRIDNKSYKQAKEIIKFDHHPGNDDYGMINIVNTELASCSELLINFISLFEKKYPLSKESSKYFYIGINGDSQRFMTSSTSKTTFEAAIVCLDKGINLSKEIYQPMYEKKIDDLIIQKYILEIFKVSKKGVAYYILKEQELKKFNIKMEQTKKYLSTFANIEGIEIWCSISEDPITHEFWISIRSKNIPISDVAKKYRGGGHALASGANLKSLDELNNFIEDLEELITNYYK